jgi:hypothetical protein
MQSSKALFEICGYADLKQKVGAEIKYKTPATKLQTPPTSIRFLWLATPIVRFIAVRTINRIPAGDVRTWNKMQRSAECIAFL